MPLVPALPTPLLPLNMPLQRLLHIAQTPLVLTLGLAQRHQKVLLARLLRIRRALALGLLLGLALRRRGLVVCLAVRLGHGNLLFFGVLLAQRGRGFDGFGGNGFVCVAGCEQSGALVRGEVCVYGRGLLQVFELLEVCRGEDGGGEEF